MNRNKNVNIRRSWWIKIDDDQGTSTDEHTLILHVDEMQIIDHLWPPDKTWLDIILDQKQTAQFFVQLELCLAYILLICPRC